MTGIRSLTSLAHVGLGGVSDAILEKLTRVQPPPMGLAERRAAAAQGLRNCSCYVHIWDG